MYFLILLFANLKSCMPVLLKKRLPDAGHVIKIDKNPQSPS